MRRRVGVNTERLATHDLEEPANLSQIDTVYHCGGGMSGFSINAYGEMGICVISQQETFSVRDVGVQPVWEGSLLKLRERKRTRVTKCIECRIQSLCGMCPANGEMENGDRESPVDFLCQVAHLELRRLDRRFPRMVTASSAPEAFTMRDCWSRRGELRTRKSMWKVGWGRTRYFRFLRIQALCQGAVAAVIDLKSRS